MEPAPHTDALKAANDRLRDLNARTIAFLKRFASFERNVKQGSKDSDDIEKLRKEMGL